MTNSATQERTSIAIHSWKDLEVFGISALTGEACAYSQRLLCDVNEEGKALLEEFWGTPDLTLAKPWNSSVDGKPSVGSVMLARDGMLSIARFALFRDSALAYYEGADKASIVGIYTQERLEQYAANNFPLVRNYALLSQQPHAGSRNVHAMTGRVI